MDDASRERCQHISDLSEDDRIFLRLSIVEFLTNVGLIPTRVAVELVDAPLEVGMALQFVVSVSFLRSFFELIPLCFFCRYDELSAIAHSPTTS